MTDEPNGIDDLTGFKVPLSRLRRQWDGMYAKKPDIRNPQDFLRGIKDDQSLPFTRPEAPDRFMAAPILWEDYAVLLMEDGINPILDEGEVATL